MLLHMFGPWDLPVIPFMSFPILQLIYPERGVQQREKGGSKVPPGFV